MSRPTRDAAVNKRPAAHGAITLRGLPFQVIALLSSIESRGPMTPASPKRRRFGLLPVRSPLLGESLLFSSPAGNEMFQFPAFACTLMHDHHPGGRVAPFGNPRVKGYLHLAVAYRGLSRPSSPPRA